MKKSISILVAYIFLLNTLLSSVGLAAPQFGRLTPSISNQYPRKVEIVNVNPTNEGGLVVSFSDNTTVTIKQSDVGIQDPKFDLRQAIYKQSGVWMVGSIEVDKIIEAYQTKRNRSSFANSSFSPTVVPQRSTHDANPIGTNFSGSESSLLHALGSTTPTATIAQDINGSSISTPIIVAETDRNRDGQTELQMTPGEPVLHPPSEEDTKKLAEEFKPSQIRKMFEEDRRVAIQEILQKGRQVRQAQRSEGTTEAWERTVFGAQTRRFPLETMMFFFSLSLINGVMLASDYSQNPLILEQHLKSLTDPIGHLSFYSFMIVNGYVTEFLNDRAMAARVLPLELATAAKRTLQQKIALGYDPKNFETDVVKHADKLRSINMFRSTKAKMAYMNMVNYFGMTAGSMASHFTGDFARTMQSCVQSFYKPLEKPAEKDAPPKPKPEDIQKDRLNRLSEDPCDVAWREWTIEKKFNQYAPALASMILSTWASGKLTGMFKKFQASPAYKAAKVNLTKGAAATFKFTGAELVTGALSGLLGGPGKRALNMLGHFTQITLFTSLDTMMHSWVEDIVLNLTYGQNTIVPNPNSFSSKTEKLYDLLEKESVEKFAKNTPACEKDIQSGECKKTDIEGFLYNFAEIVGKWKEFNQTKAFQAHSQWVEMINKYQYMEQLSKDYYGTFVTDLKTAHGCLKDMEKCKTEKIPHGAKLTAGEIEDRMAKNISVDMMPAMVNQTLFPLYGVEPVEQKNSDLSLWKDWYFERNYNLSPLQQARVNLVGAQLENYIKQRGYGSDLLPYKNFLQGIVQGLKSNDLYKNANGIEAMRAFVARPNGVSEVLQGIFFDHLNLMGSPSPLMNYGQGFTYAYEQHSTKKELIKNAEIPEFFRQLSLTTRYSFAKKTDYLMYKMLCGPSVEKGQDTSDNTLKSISEYFPGFRTLFIPPRVVGIRNEMDVCSGLFGFNNSALLYSTKITDNSDKLTYNGIFHAIFNNLTPSIKEIIKSDKYQYTADEDKNRAATLNKPLFRFDQWWEKYVEDQVVKQLEKFKLDYEQIAVKFLEAQFKEDGTLFGFIPTNAGVMRNSVVVSSMQASRLFSLILGEVVKAHLTPAEYKDLLVDANKLSGLKGQKIQRKDDLLKLQQWPWLQDFSALKSGTMPTVFKFQNDNEMVLTELYNVIKESKVVNEPDQSGKERKVVSIQFPISGQSSASQTAKESRDYQEMKRADDFEKKITEMNKELEKSIDAIKERISKKLEMTQGKEVAKPIRIISFSKDKMLHLSQDMMAAISTIKFAAFQAAKYSNKNMSKEDSERWAHAAEREKLRAKCTESKRMGTITKGCDQ